jgi:hypothetical protein
MVEGGCLCGAVRYTVDRRHLSAVHCYCAMCRRAHGGGFSTHVPMRRDQFILTAGVLQPYASSTKGGREYCPSCGTHVLVHGQTSDDSVAVPVGTLDGDPDVSVTSHIFVKDKVSWFEINDDLPQFDAWPPGVAYTHVEA